MATSSNGNCTCEDYEKKSHDGHEYPDTCQSKNDSCLPWSDVGPRLSLQFAPNEHPYQPETGTDWRVLLLAIVFLGSFRYFRLIFPQRSPCFCTCRRNEHRAAKLPITAFFRHVACPGARFLGRTLRQLGHEVRLIAAQFVKPFVKSNKNDFIEALPCGCF